MTVVPDIRPASRAVCDHARRPGRPRCRPARCFDDPAAAPGGRAPTATATRSSTDAIQKDLARSRSLISRRATSQVSAHQFLLIGLLCLGGVRGHWVIKSDGAGDVVDLGADGVAEDLGEPSPGEAELLDRPCPPRQVEHCLSVIAPAGERQRGGSATICCYRGQAVQVSGPGCLVVPGHLDRRPAAWPPRARSSTVPWATSAPVMNDRHRRAQVLDQVELVAGEQHWRRRPPPARRARRSSRRRRPGRARRTARRAPAAPARARAPPRAAPAAGCRATAPRLGRRRGRRRPSRSIQLVARPPRVGRRRARAAGPGTPAGRATRIFGYRPALLWHVADPRARVAGSTRRPSPAHRARRPAPARRGRSAWPSSCRRRWGRRSRTSAPAATVKDSPSSATTSPNRRRRPSSSSTAPWLPMTAPFHVPAGPGRCQLDLASLFFQAAADASLRFVP